MIANSASNVAIDALVFDAYGTLFDVNSVVQFAERLVPGRGAAFSQLWRSKQLEYTWLQGLMQSPVQRREDFSAVTALALDYAAAAFDVSVAGPARRRMLDAYLDLSPFPDAISALARLAPRPRLILSNGTRAMLEPLTVASGVARHLDATLSVDTVDTYKPSPKAYQLALDHLKLPPARIGFVSANAWDAIGAKAFGFTSFWINRQRAPLDRHGPKPDAVLDTLSDLLPLLGEA